MLPEFHRHGEDVALVEGVAPLRLSLAEQPGHEGQFARIPREAEEDATQQEPPFDVLKVPRFTALSYEQLLHAPPLNWLVKGLIPAEGLVLIYSAPNVGKGFLAVDLLGRIATGRKFCGLPVQKGRVLYVTAEDGLGTGARLRAWSKVWNDGRGLPAADAGFLLHEADVTNEEDRHLLVTELRRCGADHLILDTLARCFGGGDENSTQDMNAFVGFCDQIRRDAGLKTVMVMHHSGKDPKKQARGNSALKGAATTILQLAEKPGGMIAIWVEKQKHGEKRKSPLLLGRQVVRELGTDTEGNEITSCVLVPADGAATALSSACTEAELRSLKALMELGAGPTPSAAWQEATGLVERTFHNHRAKLLERALVDKIGHSYQVTTAGMAACRSGAAIAN